MQYAIKDIATILQLKEKRPSGNLLKALFSLVGVAGFEPATPCSQSRCANRTALHPEDGMGLGVGVMPTHLIICRSF